MGKLRFPKEKPEHSAKIEEAKKLLGQAHGDVQTALSAYNIISECADKNSPRAKFVKACLLYADEPRAGEYKDDIIALLNSAEKAKYPLACGIKIDYISALDDPELLNKAIKNSKYESPQALYYQAGFFAGIEPPKGIKINFAKSAVYFGQSAKIYLDYEREYRRGCKELSDIVACFGNTEFFTSQAAYSYQMLMYVYSEMNIKSNIPKYIEAYENAQKYGNLVVIYKTAASRAKDCMNNVMGMHSLKTVNCMLKTAKTAYARLNESQRDRLEENYNNLWEQYEEFYDYEMRRLEEIGNTEIYTSPDYAMQDSVLSDFTNAVRQWSESSQKKTEYTVTVDNKTYKINDLGEMVDEYGQRNGLHIDITSKKVYNSQNDAIGFFDSFGEYHNY